MSYREINGQMRFVPEPLAYQGEVNERPGKKTRVATEYKAVCLFSFTREDSPVGKTSPKYENKPSAKSH
jgi:hypothetical protein